MARGPNKPKDNPAGLSSMLYYHASIIIHGMNTLDLRPNRIKLKVRTDMFTKNRTDPTINDSSSSLDLSPLYGNSLEEVSQIQSCRGGQLHHDTFASKRVLS